MTKSESEIQSEIMLEASKRGHRLYRSNAGSIQTKHGSVIKLFPKGYPDLTGFRKGDGKFVVIEVKKPSGRLSEHQKKFAEWASTQPILYGVARSSSEAIKIVEDEEWKKKFGNQVK